MPTAAVSDAVVDDASAWRRDLHAHPELLYELPRTSAFVANKLREFGCDAVETGIGRSGVVGLLHGKGGSGGPVVALRADMDALPILEATGKPYASATPGRMHACGHDGHTAMLLGAARTLAGSRSFDGTVALVFQPAEEGGAGAAAMLADGLVERFGVSEIYGLHNMPGVALGRFGTREGALMASADRLVIEIEGVGGHAARPNLAVDPVLAAAHVIVALQSIVSRSLDPLDSGVVSITMVEGGATDNVIPARARLEGTARALRPEVRDLIERRAGEIAAATASAYGARATTTYHREYPVVINSRAEAGFAAAAARAVAGAEKVATDHPPTMGGEDFAFYLERLPGAFIFLGNGDSAGLHHPEYDFDDRAIPTGIAYWLKLVEGRLGA